MSGYSVEDNRFDLRPFLVPTWGYQFQKIKAHAEVLEKRLKEKMEGVQDEEESNID